MILLLVAFTALFSPSAPTVGDPITVQFAAPVVLEADPSYEIVSVSGTRAVVRTFQPAPIRLRGHAGGVQFRNLVIPVSSVLKKGDPLMPAPLVAPRALRARREPWIAIAAAALLAALAWLVAWQRAKPVAQRVEPVVLPAERFRRTVLSLREDRHGSLRWAALADATRLYLAATRPALGAELTTTEVLRRLHADDELLRRILAQGDLEKFSPWGALPLDFEAVATGALDLAARDAAFAVAREAA